MHSCPLYFHLPLCVAGLKHPSLSLLVCGLDYSAGGSILSHHYIQFCNVTEGTPGQDRYKPKVLEA